MQRIFILAALVISLGVWASTSMGTPPAPSALDSVVILADSNPVAATVLNDSMGLWHIQANVGSCSSTSQTSLTFVNDSDNEEYITVPQAQAEPFRVLAHQSTSIGARPLVIVQAQDGASTVYLVNQGLGYQCRITATTAIGSANLSIKGADSASWLGVLPGAGSSGSVILLRTIDWQIEMGTTSTGGGCQPSTGTPGAPVVFRNLSDKTEQIQGGPFPSPVSVAAGATQNLGQSQTWPNSSQPTGSLQVTASNQTRTAYITGFLGDGCFATATLNLVSP